MSSSISISIREILIGISIAIITAIGTYVITKERQDTKQDVMLEAVCAKAEQMNQNLAALYKEISIIQSNQAILKRMQELILLRLNIDIDD